MNGKGLQRISKCGVSQQLVDFLGIDLFLGSEGPYHLSPA
jgi:hypothetical protein